MTDETTPATPMPDPALPTPPAVMMSQVTLTEEQIKGMLVAQLRVQGYAPLGPVKLIATRIPDQVAGEIETWVFSATAAIKVKPAAEDHA